MKDARRTRLNASLRSGRGIRGLFASRKLRGAALGSPAVQLADEFFLRQKFFRRMGGSNAPSSWQRIRSQRLDGRNQVEVSVAKKR